VHIQGIRNKLEKMTGILGGGEKKNNEEKTAVRE